MTSAKQIAWRKKFAKMAKAGKFRKKKKITTAEYDKSGRMVSFGNPRKRMANPHNESESIRRRDLTLAQARKHTNDPTTMKKGVWFDGYDEQDETMIGGSSHGMDRPTGGDW